MKCRKYSCQNFFFWGVTNSLCLIASVPVSCIVKLQITFAHVTLSITSNNVTPHLLSIQNIATLCYGDVLCLFPFLMESSYFPHHDGNQAILNERENTVYSVWTSVCIILSMYLCSDVPLSHL